MFIRSRRDRRRVEIPTSSLADIAFLLLIFFLVATTIDVDTGLRVMLPPPPEGSPPEVKERNLLSILVNAEGEVLVESKPMTIPLLRHEVIRHVTNVEGAPAYAEAPRKALVSIETDPRTPYGIYIDVLDEVHVGYRKIWDAEARRLGYADHRAYTDALAPGQKDEIHTRFPANLALPGVDE